MPTNHTGDPTVDFPPDGFPADGTTPVVQEPSDGDALDAASVEQAFEMSANRLAFEQYPFANASAWAQPIKQFKNARLQDRFAVDHMGHPRLRGIQWTERWRGDEDPGAGSHTGVFEKTVERWNYVSVGTSSRVRPITLVSLTGLPTPTTSRFLQLLVGNGSGDLCSAISDFQGLYYSGSSQGNEVSASADIFLPSGETGNPSNNAYTFGQGGAFADDTALIGGVFEKKSTDANWFAVCGDGTTLSTRVDTTIPVSTRQNLRVEYWPADTADDSAAAMRFYIDDVLRATITSNLPHGAASPRINVVCAAKRITSTGASIFFGPVRYSAGY